MKMEYLASGAVECPLIRLYHFTSIELDQLCNIFASLASGITNSVELHEQPFVQSINVCRLILRTGTRDGGIERNRAGGFDCILTQSGWEDELERARCLVIAPNRFEWLLWDIPTEVQLLLSQNGLW
jgi:hypothetical protein